MKTKFFLMSLILGAALMVSCNEEPTENDLKDYLKALAPYYPYSLDETLVFKNDALEKTWEIETYDYRGNGRYPDTGITVQNDITVKSYGLRYAHISAAFVNSPVTDKKFRKSEISTDFLHSGGSKVVEMSWSFRLQLPDGEVFEGGFTKKYPPKEVISTFTDTIILTQQGGPEGAYARIVKGKGLTDFSVDGETVWRRVK